MYTSRVGQQLMGIQKTLKISAAHVHSKNIDIEMNYIDTAFENILLPKGLAFASLFIAMYCMIPYTLIMAWAILFFVNSFASDLPWNTCGKSFDIRL